MQIEHTLAMEHVCKELTFVNNFLSLRCHPGHLTLTLHLRIDKASDVMAAIWPLKFTIALDLRIL